LHFPVLALDASVHPGCLEQASYRRGRFRGELERRCGQARRLCDGSAVKLRSSQLRAHALDTFAQSTTLRGAIEQAGFVQADPIRAPARAQDLILRQRLGSYRAGELERRYPELGIEEGYLYAYGFLTRSLWQLRHPPNTKGLSKRERRLLELVAERGEAHPDHLREDFAGRALNAWGSYSTVAKLGLERLHHRGLLRVCRRDNGVRVYAPSAPPSEPRSPAERFDALFAAVLRLLAPIPEQSLRATLSRQARALGCDVRQVIAAARTRGCVEAGSLDGLTYLWPAGARPESERDVPRQVRLLAPFDPLVWDRQRFEQLWGWAYRFEAYTPIAKRVRGYYALPLLWVDRVIGWANVARAEGGLSVELGFVGSRPREREFRLQLEAEIERMRAFLEQALEGAGGAPLAAGLGQSRG
jgi:uncharacterized protein YcaQ